MDVMQLFSKFSFCLRNSLRVTRRSFHLSAATLIISIKKSDIVFTGIQPSGVPHLGNYFGAIKQWVELQDKVSHVIISVVDLHALTTLPHPDVLRSNLMALTCCLLATGINPEKCTVFQQSTVSEHTELAWILGCLTTLPRLQHLPQFKEKAGPELPLGLFSYPVLQAADILLYKANLVPVGEDQLQHIELSRHLARKFNQKYGGQVFTVPAPLLSSTLRLRSLRNPSKKMSKSDLDPFSCIYLTDTADDIQFKIRRAVTDNVSKFVTYQPEGRPGLSNLVDIYTAFTNVTPDKVIEQCKALDTVQFKDRLAEIVVEGLKPIRMAAAALLDNKVSVIEDLRKGTTRAKNIAQENMKEIHHKLGLDMGGK